MTDQQKSKKEKEPFSQYFTRIAGISALVSIVVLNLDVSLAVHDFAFIVLKYAISCWIAFVGVPYVLVQGWKHRIRITDNLFKGIRKPIEQGAELISNLNLNPVEVIRSLQSDDEQRPTNSLPQPYDRLPFNPKPFASAVYKPDIVGDMIYTAIQLAGFTIDERPEILAVDSGPTLQKISFTLPSKIQISKLQAKSRDLANHLGHHDGFQVTSASFPSSAAFVIPHEIRAFVYVRDIADDFIRFAEKAKLPAIFGKTMEGKTIFVDLVDLPHLLTAGSTGSGKSVNINTVIGSLIMARSPEQVKFLMIDPKMVELNAYKGLAHLIAPVVTDPQRAALSIKKVVVEMEKRYKNFSQSGHRNIEHYNSNNKIKIPYIIIIIDEFADLMMVARDQVEDAVQRIAQMGRACGIHLIIGTQRPSVNVITGTIKSNLPSRIAFKLPSTTDYITVLGSGAPELLNHGDGVCLINGKAKQRFQAAAITANENEAVAFIEAMVEYWSSSEDTNTNWIPDEVDEHQEMLPIFDMPLPHRIVNLEEDEEESLVVDSLLDGDEYEKAVQLAQRHQGISGTLLQRSLQIDYVTAARYIEQMANEKKIGDYEELTSMRPWIAFDNQKDPEEEFLERLRIYICRTQSAKVSDLQEILGIRKETVLQLMTKLVGEGVLHSPTSSRVGYSLAWDKQQIDRYLFEIDDRQTDDY